MTRDESHGTDGEGESGREPTHFVGYWRDPDYPEETAHLPEPQDLVDHTWDRAERAEVVGYLRRGEAHRLYAGYARCRLGCAKGGMGNRDLTDGVYAWPEGLAHYVETHDVKPPEPFLAHVRGRLRASAAPR
jgi:hypothetical protein